MFKATIIDNNIKIETGYIFADLVKDIQLYRQGKLKFTRLVNRYNNINPHVFDLASKWSLTGR